MKLSVCLATFNEEEFIHYPLDSIYDIADEIIIVDGGSEDKTEKIAKSYGEKVKVYHEDNPPMLHINKQKALDRAKGEWILQLDADEAVSPELKKEILQVINNPQASLRANNNERSNPTQEGEIAAPSLPAGRSSSTPRNDEIAGYWIPRKNYFLGRFLTKGGIYPDYTIRLYKRGKAHLPCKSVHENAEVDGKVGYLKEDLLHYADPDFSRYLKRWDRYTTLDVKILKENNIEITFIDYFFIKPTITFFSIYLRHRGYKDGFPGFVWALFSAIRHWVIYIKWWSSTSHTS